MADRFLPQSAPSTGHGGQVGVLPRICYVFVGGSRFARAVKHVGLDIPAPRFTAMAERLLPQSTPSVGHGGKVGVLPRIWHVFLAWPPFARVVKHAVFAVWDAHISRGKKASGQPRQALARPAFMKQNCSVCNRFGIFLVDPGPRASAGFAKPSGERPFCSHGR